MDWLKQNWFKVIILAFIFCGFYWYSVRPVQLKKKCYDLAIGAEPKAGIYAEYLEDRGLRSSNFEMNYKSCLLDNGL